MKNKKTLISGLAGVMAAVLLLSLLAGIIPAVSAKSASELRDELNTLKTERKQ